MAAHGVRFLKETDVVGVDRAEDGTLSGVKLGDGGTLPCEMLVVGVGMRPNIALAEAAGLACDVGVLTDDGMRASAADVFAAGDVAEPEIGGVRKANLIHPNASATGRVAGANMAGGDEAMPAHLPDMNVLTVFGRSFLQQFHSPPSLHHRKPGGWW